MVRRLSAEELRATCDPASLPFRTTAEVTPLEGMIGQERAMSATAFGIAMKAPGYNLFVVGASGTGKASSIRSLLDRAAAAEPTPPDLLYVHNFEDSYHPRALTLPAGRGRELGEALARTVEACRTRLGRLFEEEEFGRRESAIRDEFSRRDQANLARIEEIAAGEGFRVQRSAEGLAVGYAPGGQAMAGEEYSALPAAERQRIEALASAVEAKVEPLARQFRQIEREAEQALERNLRAAAAAATRELWADLSRRFAGLAPVESFLAAVQQDLLAHAEAFRSPEEEDEDDGDEDEEEPRDAGSGDPASRRRLGFLEHYRVNLLVDRSALGGAPVVIEGNPTYANLVGRLEHRIQLGSLMTDLTLIKAGALHRANGGYLLLEAADVAGEPFAWDALKRALKSGSVRIEEPPEDHRMAAASLLPEPVPLAVKVVLLGPPSLYYPLYDADEDFRELFKVKVDFDESLVRSRESEVLLARFVAGACREHRLAPFTAAAVAAVIDWSSRRVSHQRRLSARLGDLVNLLRESSFWAAEAGHELVEAGDVRQAIERKTYRSSLLEEQLGRMTREGELLLSTAGASVGQVNAVTVVSIGDHEFGRPMRITARARPGRPGLLDIEREVGLGGSIHSKGVLILTGYLAGRYAPSRRLAMAAYLAAEQNYQEIEGDSASLAELAALLSAIASRPLAQGTAVTGAVNQQGEVQAVGGVNEKIEGFFGLCRERGLDGGQGVILPEASTHHLMLGEEVVAAVAAGRFHLHPVRHVDEAIEVLTGEPAGERDGDGGFAARSFNQAVERTLGEWADLVGDRRE